MSTQTFSHAGVSRLNGDMKVRFANDALRTKVLQKNGHKDIDIVELKNPMTKEDAVAYLLSIDFATRDGVTNKDVQAALVEAQTKREPKAKTVKSTKTAKAPKAKAVKPTIESIKAKAKTAKTSMPTDMEDAPF